MLYLLLAVSLGVFAYSPLRTMPDAVLAVQVVLFPLLAVSGLLVWHGRRLRQRFKSR